jgi:His/Glu/Gln/Arg/opine family amino acid ABC transporter permease subunit
MPQVLLANLPYLLQGAGVTLLLTAASGALAALVGAIVALAQIFGGPAGRALGMLYTLVVRGVPLIVLIFGMYYALPYAGIELGATEGGILVLGLYFGAFMAEVFRGALQAVPRGQWDAGRAMGMYGGTLLLVVIVPQALRLAAPPFVNTFVMLVKGTSIVSVIGLWELTLAGRQVVERTLAAFQVFGGVAAIYFVICFALTSLGRAMERRLPAHAG